VQLGRMGQYTEDQRGRGARDRDRDQARMQRRQGQTQEGNVQPQNQQGIESESTDQQRIANQIVIQNPGLVHLGSVYNMNIGQAFTQLNRTNNTTTTQQGQQTKEEKEGEKSVESADPRFKPPDKEFLRPLWCSKRVVDGDELLRISKNIGKNWKSVGNGLKFNWATLEQFETDTRSHNEAVHRMLYRWIQWKDQKATVGKLTKALFNHREYEAILSLNP